MFSWKIRVPLVLAVVAVLMGGATSCPETGGGTMPKQADTAQSLIVDVMWRSASRKNHLPIEISYTVPGHPTQDLKVSSKRDDHYQFAVRLLPKQRVSITADQQERGWLQCTIEVDGRLKIWHYITTYGSVSCSWTNETVRNPA